MEALQQKSTERKVWKVRGALFLLVVFTYLLCASGAPWIEGNSQLLVAERFIQHATLALPVRLSDYYPPGGGGWYDPHGLTNVVYMLPVALARPFINRIVEEEPLRVTMCVGALSGIPVTALMCVLFFSLLELFRIPLRVCFYTSLCLAFLTIVFVYGTRNYEGNLNTLFMLGSFYFLILYERAKRFSSVWYSGICAGLAINTRIETSWIFLLCISFYVLELGFRGKSALVPALFFLSVVPFVAVWGWYNWLRTGRWYLTPIAMKVFEGGGSFSFRSTLLGIRGLCFSNGGSIFAYSPIVLIALLGWKEFYCAHKRACIFVLSVILSSILVVSSTIDWFGSYGWGPRYTLEITPLLMLPLAFWLSGGHARGRAAGFLSIAVACYSMLIQFAGTFTNWHSRFGSLIERGLVVDPFFTMRGSQWWDSVRTLWINIWNAALGSQYYIANPGYDVSMSAPSWYCSQTILAWWNRLLYLGVPVVLVSLYLWINLTVIVLLFLYVHSLTQGKEDAIATLGVRQSPYGAN